MASMPTYVEPLPVTPVVEDEFRGIVAPRARLFAWAQIAKPGDRFVYATKSRLPALSDGARAARELQKAKLAYLYQKPSDLFAGEWVYLAERSSTPWPEPRPVLSARAPAGDAGDVDAGEAILPALERAAQFRLPCPTDKDLARRGSEKLGGEPFDVERVRAGLEALVARHVIRIVAASRPTLRLVTIVATGAQTGYVR